MLEDRVHINLDKPQRSGSQLIYNDLGQSIPKNGLVDATQVDQLRLEFNLPPFKEYCNGMTQSHFEMNKVRFLEKGITEPKLYE